MDITQYRLDALFTPRDIARAGAQAQAKSSTINEVPPVDPVAGQPPPEDGFSLFDTMIDTVNPLQHIPGVSTAYQAATGDESNALASMAGGYLFGGPVGLAAGAASSFLEFLTGKDLMGHAMAMFGGDEEIPIDPTDEGGLEHIETAAVQRFESLFHQSTSKGVEQYHAFAQAEAQQNAGTGADVRDVNWSSNIWTAQALKEATGLYEHNQGLGKSSAQPTQRGNAHLA